jgi:hypothetical protein
MSGDAEEKTRGSEQDDQRYDQRFFNHAGRASEAKANSTETSR